MDQMQGAAILLTGIFVGMAISQMDLGARSPKREQSTGKVYASDGKPVPPDAFDMNYVAVHNLDFGPHPDL